MRKTIKQLQGESDYWRIKFINEQQRAEAAEAKLAEYEKQERPKAVVRHYTGCKYPVIKVNSLEVVIAGGREDAEELADFINAIHPAPAVSLVELVPQRKPITLDAPISAEWAARTSGYRSGFNDCVDEILRNIEGANK